MITWEQWARDWLSGKDRSESAAWAWAEWAADSAVWPAEWSAHELRRSVDILACARRAMK